MGVFSNLLGTVLSTFKVGRATVDASGLNAARTFTLPDQGGRLMLDHWVTAGGTADALTATYSPAVTLVDGMILRLRAASANATTTPTLAVNGGAASTIVKKGSMPLAAGDISGADHELLLVVHDYFSYIEFELLNPSGNESGTWVPLGSVVVSGGAVTYVEVTGFDGSLYSAIVIEFSLKNPLAGGNTLSLYCAYDGGAIGTTATDYYRQSINGDGTLSGARANSGQFGSMGAAGADGYIAGEAKVWQGRDGGMKAMVQSNSNRASLTIFRHYNVSRVTAGTDITGVRITGSANGLDNGSEFHAYGILK